MKRSGKRLWLTVQDNQARQKLRTPSGSKDIRFVIHDWSTPYELRNVFGFRISESLYQRVLTDEGE